jgi:hypothetical protein
VKERGRLGGARGSLECFNARARQWPEVASAVRGHVVASMAAWVLECGMQAAQRQVVAACCSNGPRRQVVWKQGAAAARARREEGDEWARSKFNIHLRIKFAVNEIDSKH